MTLLLVYQQGIRVGKYISLERIVEENKTEYYEALKKSSKDWHKSQHNPIPWIQFFLSTIRQAYKELAENVSTIDSLNVGKGELVEKAILNIAPSFTLRDIQLQFPTVSNQMIKKVLSDLKKSKKVVLIGRGRGAKWKVK